MQDQKRVKNAKNVQRIVTIELPVSNRFGIPDLADFFAEIQRHYDVEKNIKNNLYAFILEQGLFEELRQYGMTHDMTSPDGHMRAVKEIFSNCYSEFKN